VALNTINQTFVCMCVFVIFRGEGRNICTSDGHIECPSVISDDIMYYSNITSFKRFESKPVVKIILIYDRLNLWRHRQFITIFYQFLHIRIEIIHGNHMYILFLPRVGLYVSFLPLANARGKTSWHKGLPMVKTIYTYGFHELFLNYSSCKKLSLYIMPALMLEILITVYKLQSFICFSITLMLSSVKTMASSRFGNSIFDSSLLLLKLNISWIWMNIICQSLYYQYILDKFHFF
jgi:hypothetical protein